jgi:malonyl-CoA O-methyltransferase
MRDKRLVAASFSRAAPRYDRVAGLQRRIADQLSAWLSDEPLERVLDLGSGTGYANPWLRERAEQLLNIDLAEGMLDFARSRGCVGIHIAGDAEALPLADATVDLIWSSLALQWSEQPQALISELCRVVRPGGRILISTLGPSTLFELRDAWAAVNQQQHVNQFISPTEWLNFSTELELVRHQQSAEVEYYAEVGQLLRELRTLGAHNVNPERRQGLGGQAELKAMMQHYQQFRTELGIPASYEVHYLEFIRR